ncbi:MAG: heavy-metal-associated domain-containing protein [Saprospirales bacterium]|nr:heavy-metal-associated domain-containing protein [Saprospirales bacterium]MBK8492067.1 heavy-metal-associated domain-containing protein [Saprospirales bacterium]
MNTSRISILALLVLILGFTTTASAEDIKETFKVWGNCGMCKTTIETAVKKVDGVKTCKWDAETKMLTVKFDDQKTTLDDIKKSIAAVGYDTEEFRAPDDVYSKLHGCCQYDRPPSLDKINN